MMYAFMGHLLSSVLHTVGFSHNHPEVIQAPGPFPLSGRDQESPFWKVTLVICFDRVWEEQLVILNQRTLFIASVTASQLRWLWGPDPLPWL